jgi:hypothetical protein
LRTVRFRCPFMKIAWVTSGERSHSRNGCRRCLWALPAPGRTHCQLLRE